MLSGVEHEKSLITSGPWFSMQLMQCLTDGDGIAISTDSDQTVP